MYSNCIYAQSREIAESTNTYTPPRNTVYLEIYDSPEKFQYIRKIPNVSRFLITYVSMITNHNLQPKSLN